MAKLFLRPSGTSGTPQLIPSGAAAGWQCVDESSPDDFTTYVYQSAAEFGVAITAIDLYLLENYPTGTAGTINSVTIRYRGAIDGMGVAEQFRCGIRTGSSTNYLDSVRIPTAMTTYTKVWTTNPRVGGAWTWAQINALLLVAYINVEGDEVNPAGAQITWMEIEVSYDPQVTPSVLSMVCASLTPTVTATPDLVEVTPATATMTAAALAPVLSRRLLPAAAGCAVSALIPALWRTVQPGVVGCSLSVVVPATGRLVLPNTAGCSLVAQAPELWRIVLPNPAACSLTARAPELWRTVSPAVVGITVQTLDPTTLRVVSPATAGLLLLLPAPILGHVLLPAVLDLNLTPLEATIGVHRLLSPATLVLQMVPLALLLPRRDELLLTLVVHRGLALPLHIRRMLELEVER